MLVERNCDGGSELRRRMDLMPNETGALVRTTAVRRIRRLGGWALAAIALGAACGRASDAGARDGERESVAGKATPPTRAVADSAGRQRTVVFAGTSLTAGLGLDPDSAYPQLVARKIDSAGLPFVVINAGVSGETTAGLLQRLGWLLDGRFDVLVIESGANDGLRGVSVETMRRNLDSVVVRVQRSHPAARVVLVQMEAPPNLGGPYARAFHDAFQSVARERGVTLMPFLLDRVAGIDTLNQADGIHPNIVGERIVADNVWRTLEPILRELAARPSSASGDRR